MTNARRHGAAPNPEMEGLAGARAASPSSRAALRELIGSIQLCASCPTMCGQGGILRAVGARVQRPIMFVAEAPGRLGALKTGLPLSGDVSGENFEALLRHAGWTRRDVWVTNAVLCWPASPEGNNRSPSRAELTNCVQYLRTQIALVRPIVVAPLGVAALSALNLLSPVQSLLLRTAVARPQPWLGRYLFPLYHPSPRVVNTCRRMPQQRADFRALSRFAQVLSRSLFHGGVPQPLASY